jgi:hypothetical protein
VYEVDADADPCSNANSHCDNGSFTATANRVCRRCRSGKRQENQRGGTQYTGTEAEQLHCRHVSEVRNLSRVIKDSFRLQKSHHRMRISAVCPPLLRIATVLGAGRRVCRGGRKPHKGRGKFSNAAGLTNSWRTSRLHQIRWRKQPCDEK